MPKKKLIVIPLTVGSCADCGDEVVLINGYGYCRCGCPGILKDERDHKCYVTNDVLDGIGLRRKAKKRAPKKCWLCGGFGANTTIETECETPGGKHCDVKTVDAHFACVMDME